MKPQLQTLSKFAMAEGFSLLILMGIGMPLKYALGFPEFIKIFGWVHGLLFIGFGLMLAKKTLSSDLPLLSSVLIFASAFVPGGNFWAEKHLRSI